MSRTIPADRLRRLVVLLPNWLGDAVMSEPALSALNRTHPDLEIIACGRPAAVEALRGQCGLSTVLSMDDRGVLGPLRAARMIRAEKPDAILIMRGSFRSALVAALSGCPIRIGTPGDGRRALITHRIDPPAGTGPRPTTRLYEDLVGSLQVEVPERPPSIEIAPRERDAAEALLEGLERPIIGIVPGGSKIPKRWPAERFAESIRRLGDRIGSCVLLGGPDELDLLRDLHARCDTPEHPPVRNLADEGLSLATLRGVIDSCDVLICNDTGPRHLAIATGTPTVALFGPTDHRWTLIPGAKERLLLAEPFLDDDHVADRHPDACRIDRIAVGDVVHATVATIDSSVSSPT
ncbi:MAG: hypothetical protein CMJ34_14850 [Phycisphaerae bacterium]|nr:hypothetical protein [Phycisphaerae bacterium]